MTVELEARPRRSTVSLVLRVLLLLGMLAAAARVLSDPVDRPLGELLAAIDAGAVDSVVVQVPPAGAQRATGTYGVLWQAEDSWRDRFSTYQLDGVTGPGPVLDEVADAVEPVEVRTTTSYDLDPRVRSGLAPYALVWVGVVLLLALGPAPRRATRWAWWWLGLCLPVALAVFLVVEPSRTPHRALTGGKALLLGLVAGGIGKAAWPDLSGVLWSYGS